MLMMMSALEGVVAVMLLVGFGAGQGVLPPDEVDGLRAVGLTLGKNDWDFTVNPCSNSSGWFEPNSNPKHLPNIAVKCNCSYDSNTTCHVTTIYLREQDLGGTLPPELTRLPFLEEIDLTRNYLNGTIPKEWGSMRLRIISLLGNRITGRIPKELGNITTLEELVLEHNQLNDVIPPELGNLTRIRRLLFASNNLTGELPASLANLTTLKEFRVSSNNLMGRIPNFIQNWRNIERLIIQGSGLAGPIPLSIALLTNLTDLRISDLSGDDSTFPDLSNMRKLKTLILRSCNIVGQLPGFLGQMNVEKLKTLDLSFNKLTGSIPENFKSLSPVDFIYFTGNSFSGRVPTWMLQNGEAIDLSYNNFTYGQNQGCQPTKTNLFASSKGNKTGIVSCLRVSGCLKNYSSVYINCGGPRVDDESNSYEADTNSGGPSNFYSTDGANWAYSNTGHFLDDESSVDSFTQSNTSSISGPNSQLYENARLSALSLTYYAFCLINGNYTVNLHFAEIMFTNDSTHGSLGRRLFDVYIQGKLVLKDFNIQTEAGGVNRGIRKNFTVVVNDNALDIRFYWAGKGTTDIPKRGVYGPLISAISIVNPNAPRSVEDKNGDGISVGAIVGIVLAVLFSVFLVLGILWWKGCLWRDDSMHDLKGLDLHTGSFSLRQIKAATNNFDPANKIGEGGFGPVYKGFLLDGAVIAVKQLSSKSKQGNREFLNEIGMISALQHPHLVKLYGCCIEGNQLLLVYEYMENNSLARALFGPKDHQLHLDWPTRQKICIGIARGLAYLHEESRLKIVHRDIKATNVLLDKNLVPKISDFGLAKLDEENDTHISTRVAGTYGYMAPEYAMRGHLTDKADVYSFGVVLLEIVCGRSNTSIRPKEANFYLLDWAKSLKEKGDLLELVDPRLASNFNRKEVMTTINVALICTNAVAAERPSMSTVVSMLEGKGNGVYEFIPGTSFSGDEMSRGDAGVDEQSVLMDVPWTASTDSTDLYPISVNTEYWNKRDP